jgi:hypothetical protein
MSTAQCGQFLCGRSLKRNEPVASSWHHTIFLLSLNFTLRILVLVCLWTRLRGEVRVRRAEDGELQFLRAPLIMVYGIAPLGSVLTEKLDHGLNGFRILNLLHFPAHASGCIARMSTCWWVRGRRRRSAPPGSRRQV